MKAVSFFWSLVIVRLATILPATAITVLSTWAHAQGTITFDSRPYFSGTDYFEAGMHLGLVVPTPGTGSPSYDGMAATPAVNGASNIPYNPTPYLVFFRQFSPDNYIRLTLTSSSAFGLTSVQLADSRSPSSEMLPITFIGQKVDGSVVRNTFTTPGSGADHLLTYQFNSDFAYGLLSVQIDAQRWAMDDLVYTVPEPSASLLGLLGGATMLYAQYRRSTPRRD